jgi:hypothetical protein
VDSIAYVVKHHSFLRRPGLWSFSPEVEFINIKSCKILRFLPITIHERVFPLDFSPAIDFSSPGSRLWISFIVEFKITSFPPVVIGGELA